MTYRWRLTKNAQFRRSRSHATPVDNTTSVYSTLQLPSPSPMMSAASNNLMLTATDRRYDRHPHEASGVVATSANPNHSNPTGRFPASQHSVYSKDISGMNQANNTAAGGLNYQSRNHSFYDDCTNSNIYNDIHHRTYHQPAVPCNYQAIGSMHVPLTPGRTSSVARSIYSVTNYSPARSSKNHQHYHQRHSIKVTDRTSNNNMVKHVNCREHPAGMRAPSGQNNVKNRRRNGVKNRKQSKDKAASRNGIIIDAQLNGSKNNSLISQRTCQGDVTQSVTSDEIQDLGSSGVEVDDEVPANGVFKKAKKAPNGARVVHSVHYYYEAKPSVNGNDSRDIKVVQPNGSTEVYVPLHKTSRRNRRRKSNCRNESATENWVRWQTTRIDSQDSTDSNPVACPCCHCRSSSSSSSTDTGDDYLSVEEVNVSRHWSADRISKENNNNNNNNNTKKNNCLKRESRSRQNGSTSKKINHLHRSSSVGAYLVDCSCKATRSHTIANKDPSTTEIPPAACRTSACCSSNLLAPTNTTVSVSIQADEDVIRTCESSQLPPKNKVSPTQKSEDVGVQADIIADDAPKNKESPCGQKTQNSKPSYPSCATPDSVKQVMGSCCDSKRNETVCNGIGCSAQKPSGSYYPHTSTVESRGRYHNNVENTESSNNYASNRSAGHNIHHHSNSDTIMSAHTTPACHGNQVCTMNPLQSERLYEPLMDSSINNTPDACHSHIHNTHLVNPFSRCHELSSSSELQSLHSDIHWRTTFGSSDPMENPSNVLSLHKLLNRSSGSLSRQGISRISAETGFKLMRQLHNNHNAATSQDGICQLTNGSASVMKPPIHNGNGTSTHVCTDNIKQPANGNPLIIKHYKASPVSNGFSTDYQQPALTIKTSTPAFNRQKIDADHQSGISNYSGRISARSSEEHRSNHHGHHTGNDKNNSYGINMINNSNMHADNMRVEHEPPSARNGRKVTPDIKMYDPEFQSSVLLIAKKIVEGANRSDSNVAPSAFKSNFLPSSTTDEGYVAQEGSFNPQQIRKADVDPTLISGYTTITDTLTTEQAIKEMLGMYRHLFTT